MQDAYKKKETAMQAETLYKTFRDLKKRDDIIDREEEGRRKLLHKLHKQFNEDVLKSEKQRRAEKARELKRLKSLKKRISGRGAGASTGHSPERQADAVLEEVIQAVTTFDNTLAEGDFHKARELLGKIKSYIGRATSLKNIIRQTNGVYDEDTLEYFDKIEAEIDSAYRSRVIEFNTKLEEQRSHRQAKEPSPKPSRQNSKESFNYDDYDLDTTPPTSRQGSTRSLGSVSSDESSASGSGIGKVKTAEEIGSQAVRLIEEIERLLNIDDAKQASIYYPQYKRHKKVFNELYDKLEDSYSLTPALRAMRKHMEDIEDSLKNR